MPQLERAVHFTDPLRIDTYDAGSSVVAPTVWELGMTIKPPMPREEVEDSLVQAHPLPSETPLKCYAVECGGTTEELDDRGLANEAYLRFLCMTMLPVDEHTEAADHLRELAPRLAFALGATTVTYGWE